MDFWQDGTPHSIRASTHCSWTAPAELDMVDGRATYIILSDHLVPLFYDAAQASCTNCRRNADRGTKQEESKTSPSAQI